jgi:hypothetical protein
VDDRYRKNKKAVLDSPPTAKELKGDFISFYHE